MCLLLLSCSSLLAQTTTYNFTGSPQTYTVPAGVFNISIEAYGAQGNSNAQSVAGGLGGYATGELSVTPGEVLTIYVGGGGTVSTTGGYNGGGDAGFSPCGAAMGGGGGGASDVRQGGTTLSDRVIVGGGGSGPGGSRIAGCGRGTGGGGGGGYYGGGGGAAWPFQSATPGGTGGTQATGGTGGTSTYTSVLNNNGTNGTLGQGGNGGEEVSTSQGGSGTANVGSAGGGLTGDTGTYGVNWTGAGGGGGSSYVGGLANSATTSGVQSGNGQVLITVLGNQPPVAVCQDYTAQLDGSGNVTIQAADVDGGSTDPDMDTLILSVSPDTFTCANIGPNTVTLTVDDGNGGVDTCTATVTVEDTIAPIITCPSDVTVACDEDVLPGSSVPLQLYGTDAASGNLINIDMASGIGSIVGNSSARVGIAWNSNTDVTYARDFSNLYTIDLTTATTTLIGPSGASITALTFDSTQSVLYSINQGTRDFYEIDPATGTATLIGNTGIPGGTTLGLATDASGTVWVGTINGDLYTVDTNTGVATLQYNTVYADGLTSMAIHPTTGSLYIVSLINDELVEVDLSTGTSTLIGGPVGGNDMRGLAFVGGVSGGSLPAATASDNCTGNPTITFSDVETPGSCPQERTITRTWTATDASGNSSSCVQTITVVDTTAPVVTCPSDVTTNNDPGACGAVVTYTVSGTDNCGMVTVTQTGGLASGDLFPVGTTTNTFDITDECGNTSTCSFTVTVNDTEAPTAVCQDITVQLDATGNATIVPADVDGGSVDNCGVDSISFLSGGAGLTINQILTLGNGSDGEAIAFNPSNGLMYHASGLGDGSEYFETVDLNTLTVGPNLFPGNTGLPNEIFGMAWYPPLNGFIAMDINSNIFLIDSAGATTLLSNFETNLRGLAVVGTRVFGVDPFGANIYELDPNTGATLNSVPVVIDGTPITSGSTGLTTHPITGEVYIIFKSGGPNRSLGIIDPETGIGTDLGNTFQRFSGISFDAAGNLYAISGDGATPPETLFEIETSSVTSSMSYTCSDIGPNTVTLLVTDVNGNSSQCTATVTVEDNVAPMAVCQDITIQLDNLGNATIVASDVDGGSTDACGIDTLSIDVDTFDCSDVGTNPVVLTVTDVNGNSSTCTATVTVEDNVAPMAVCQDITVQLDAAGNATIVASDVDGGSTDACGIDTLSIDVDTFDCSDVGTNPVVLTVTDVNGNSSTCTATVTVEDNVAPMAVCQDITVQLDAAGNATIVASDVDGGSTDACGIASLAIDVDTFDCSDVGTNPVVLTVTDVNGNSSTCTATVTVEDNIAPVIACPMDITLPNDPGVCGAEVNFGDASAADACGIATVLQTAGLPSGSTFPVGTSTVEFTATDVNGNTSTCTFTVTVQDTELPVAVCQDITIQLDALGAASITAADIDGGSSDNCGVASISASQTDFDCSDVGDNNITLTVTDVNGNTSTCVAVVTVEDVTAPVVACTDITVILDVNGTVTINGTDIDGGSSDACGIATYELDIDTFDCSNVGDNPVTLTVTDVNGNSASCTATVTVIDDIAPDLVCMDITLELDENGFASIVPEDVMANNTDACGILTTGVDIEDFSCADIGTPVLVTVFSQDNNGNLSSCTATVTVVDVTGPVIENCPGDLTVDPGVNNLFYELPDYWATTDVTATDNCTDPVTVFGQDPAPGTLLPDGTYTITLTTEDEYGNESSCSFELTVESVLGTQEVGIDISSVALYPNPAKDVVTLHNPQSVVVEQAVIYDLNGKLVRTFDLRGQGTQNYTLDVSTLQMATYLVVIQTEKGTVTKQLIKG